jgi:drug/metabolite transporter (DMT)-like permease
MALQEIEARRKGLIAVVLAAVLWSTGGVFIKLLSLSPYSILGLRALFSAALFALLFRANVLKFSWNILLVALFNAALVTTYVVSMKLTTAANSIFLQYTAPVYLILLEPLLFRFKLQRINILTVVVCIFGMALFFMGDLEIGDMRGNLLALASGVFLAAMMLAQRFNPPAHHEAAIFQGNLLVTLIFLPAVLQGPAPNPTEWAMLAFLGLIQLGLGYALFTYGLKRVPAFESSLLAMLEPILNPVWVLIGYGERPSATALLGGAVIVGMLILRIIIIESSSSPKAVK